MRRVCDSIVQEQQGERFLNEEGFGEMSKLKIES